MIRFLFLLLLLISASCERSDYSNRFSTPVTEISNGRIRLADGRRVRIPAAGREGTTVLILVRHAEKAMGDNPPLTEKGRLRAARLAGLLAKTDLDVVFATPYQRTQQTARPVAEAQGLPVSPYDPSRLQDFLDLMLLQHKGQHVLIVGHANTTPELLNLLVGRKAYQQLAEDDFDTIFVASVDRSGKPSVFTLRYGVE